VTTLILHSAGFFAARFCSHNFDGGSGAGGTPAGCHERRPPSGRADAGTNAGRGGIYSRYFLRVTEKKEETL